MAEKKGRKERPGMGTAGNGPEYQAWLLVGVYDNATGHQDFNDVSGSYFVDWDLSAFAPGKIEFGARGSRRPVTLGAGSTSRHKSPRPVATDQIVTLDVSDGTVEVFDPPSTIAMQPVHREGIGSVDWTWDRANYTNQLVLTTNFTVTCSTSARMFNNRPEMDTVDLTIAVKGVTSDVCLAASTLIATPGGDMRITEVRVGTMVWTQAADGSRVAAPVVKVGSIQAPPEHLVVHLVLADGRELLVSPGHETADGRQAGSLHAADQLDGSGITRCDLEPYVRGRTHDLLPAGATGRYWANGILLSSTLSARAAQAQELLAEPAFD